jgi:hypothetical protein
MALSDDFRRLVNDIKVARKSRKAFAEGMRQISAQMKEEHRQYFENVKRANEARAQEAMAFLASAKEQRMQQAEEMRKERKLDIDRVHQAAAAIKQGAVAYMDELHRDTAERRMYWEMLDDDEPIPDPNAPPPSPKKSPNSIPISPQNSAQSAVLSKETDSIDAVNLHEGSGSDEQEASSAA